MFFPAFSLSCLTSLKSLKNHGSLPRGSQPRSMRLPQFNGGIPLVITLVNRGSLVDRGLGKHYLEPVSRCRMAPQQVEIRLPQCRDTHAIIRSRFYVEINLH